MINTRPVKLTTRTLTHLLPREYVKTVAVARGVSKAELAALELALDGYSTTEISRLLELSSIAVRKRLGEVYRKFNITGSGSGKLVQLKQQLRSQFASTTHLSSVQGTPQSLQIDWGEAPDLPGLVGRTQELEQLQQHIKDDRARLVAILGMAKMGKTALALKLVEHIQSDFKVVIWRSLRYAPSLDELLAELIQTLSGSPTVPTTTVKRIFQLIECFRKQRCLVVLDEMETLFQNGQLAGSYQEGYQVYGELLRQVGELSHESCLMIVSQVEPLEIAVLARMIQSVRVFRLQGLSEADGTELIGSILPKSFAQREKTSLLIQHCGGNPLLLRLVAQRVLELFDGDLELFYEHNQLLWGKFDPFAWIGIFLNLVFQDQLELSADEHQVLNSLVLFADKPSLLDLQSQIPLFSDRSKLLNTLESLERRVILQKFLESGEVKLSLNPIFRQYTIQKIKEKIYKLTENQSNLSVDKLSILDAFNFAKLEKQQKEDLLNTEIYQKIGKFLNQMGYSHYMAGELYSAKIYLNLAVQFHPNLTEAHFNLGATYDKLKDISSAKIYYQRAIASPSKARYLAQSNLARLEIIQGNPQTAIELIEPILEEAKDPVVITTLYKNLGWAYFKNNLYQLAEDALLKALNLDDKCVSAYYLLAQVKSAQGKEKDALEYWKKGLDCPIGKGALTEPWKWPEIEEWKLEAHHQLQREPNS